MAKRAAKAEVDDLELEDIDEAEEEEETSAKKRSSKKSSKKDDKPKGIGARQVAERLKAEPKTFRAWLRRKIADGQFPELEDREAKTRYNFGETWEDPLVVKIMELWESEPHERGAGLKKAQEAKKKASSSTKRKPRKKAADDEDDED